MALLSVINCVVNVPFSFMAVVGNGLLLAAFITTPGIRSPSYAFLCSLAVSDLLVGLVVQPIHILYLLNFLTLLYPAIVWFSTVFLVTVSMSTMTTISLDRFLALYCHMRYPSLMTEKRASYIAITLWVVSFVSACLYVWSKNLVFLFPGYAFYLLMTTFCYTGIYRILRRHQLQIQVEHQALRNLNNENTGRLISSRKSAINTFIFYIFMLLCYTPSFALILFLIARPDLRELSVWHLGSTLVFVNSSINPILFCWRLRELRKAVYKVLDRCVKFIGGR